MRRSRSPGAKLPGALRRAFAGAIASGALACSLVYPWEPVADRAEDAIYADDYEQADQLADRALGLAAELPDADPRKIALVVLKGRIAFLAHRDAEAADLLTDALERGEAAYGESDPRLAPTLLQLGQIAVRRRDPETATAHLDRLLEIDDETAAVGACTVGSAYGLLGAAYVQSERWEDAMEAYRSAAHILESSGPILEYYRVQRARVALLRERGRVGQAEGIEDNLRPPGNEYLWEVLVQDRRPHFSDVRYASRWRRDQMPLRVSIPAPPEGAFRNPAAVVETVRRTLLEWQNVVEPGLPSFVFVEDGEDADIPFRWAERLPLAVVGVTSRRWSPTGGRFAVDYIALRTSWGPGGEIPLESLSSAVRHEVGHALGLFGHSPSPLDVMFEALQEVEIGLSEADRQTLRELYALKPGARVRCLQLMGSNCVADARTGS